MSGNVASANEAGMNIDQDRPNIGKTPSKVLFATFGRTISRLVKTKGSKSLPEGSAAFHMTIRSPLSRKHGWNLVSNSLSTATVERMNDNA